MNFFLTFTLALLATAFAVDPKPECWIKSSTRSVSSPNSCGNGMLVAGLCYKPCAPGDVQQSTGWCRRPNWTVYIYDNWPYAPDCPSDTVKQAGLCYSQCNPGYTGIGFVCWQDCPTDFPVKCGFYCGKSQSYCNARNIEITASLGQSALSILSNPDAISKINGTLSQAQNLVNEISGHKDC